MLFIGPSQAPPGRLIISLGKRAGAAVVRSRVRRIVRDVYRVFGNELRSYDLLLGARQDVSNERRRDLRVGIESLLRRALGVVRQRPSG